MCCLRTNDLRGVPLSISVVSLSTSCDTSFRCSQSLFLVEAWTYCETGVIPGRRRLGETLRIIRAPVSLDGGTLSGTEGVAAIQRTAFVSTCPGDQGVPNCCLGLSGCKLELQPVNIYTTARSEDSLLLNNIPRGTGMVVVVRERC